VTLAAPTPSALRHELTETVVRDLLGPAGGPEVELNRYEDHVYSRCPVGMLARKGSEVPRWEWDERVDAADTAAFSKRIQCNRLSRGVLSHLHWHRGAATSCAAPSLTMSRRRSDRACRCE
jgi:hypothetical protein